MDGMARTRYPYYLYKDTLLYDELSEPECCQTTHNVHEDINGGMDYCIAAVQVNILIGETGEGCEPATEAIYDPALLLSFKTRNVRQNDGADTEHKTADDVY